MKPTLKELNHASMNGGRLPDSYFERTGKSRDVVEPEPRGTEVVDPKAEEPETEEPAAAQEEPAEEGTEENYPKDSGGGWWELSNGQKVRGEDAALEAQAKLE